MESFGASAEFVVARPGYGRLQRRVGLWLLACLSTAGCAIESQPGTNAGAAGSTAAGVPQPAANSGMPSVDAGNGAASGRVTGAAGAPQLASPAGAGSGAGAGVGAAGSSPSLPTGTSSGLPCDLDQLLRQRCQKCHSRPPTMGAPMPLMTYADLTAPAKSDPSRRAIDLVVTRMQRGQMPPAPDAPATSAEVAIVQSWMAGGALQGACASAGGSTDGGVVGGSTDAAVAPPVINTPSMCTSGAHWTNGDNGSPSMHPGGACITCHARKNGPTFVIAGTVYPSAHEPIDCNGVDGSSQAVSVVITDSSGKVTTLSVNAVGNFRSTQQVAFPFHAKVVSGGRERQMSAAQMTGNCNECHTETGANGAPGRIMAP